MQKKSLLMLVMESFDVATFSLLEGKEPDQQVAELEKLFSIALLKGSDDTATKFGSWILHTMSTPDDVERQKISKERAEKAISLWKEFKFRQGTLKAIAKDEFLAIPNHKRFDSMESYLRNKVSSFSATKIMLLTEVLDRWRNTEDKSEADCLFQDFLLPEFFHTQSDQAGQELLRKFTDHFQTDRLMQHIVLMRSAKKDFNEELMRILFVAWARRASVSDFMMKFPILEPLTGCSEEAHGLMESLSKKMAVFDNDVKYLIWVLGSSPKGSQPKNYSEYESLFGTECSTSYKSLDLLEVNLEMAGVGSTFKETEGHEWFEKARRNIKLWQETYEHGVHLRVSVKDKYDKKEIFSRGEELLIKY